MSFITTCNYDAPHEDGWRNTKFNPSQFAYLNNGDSTIIKLIQVRNDYKKILFKKYVIKNEILVKRIDSTMKDTTSPYIRYVNYFQDDSTKYIFFTIKAQTRKKVITNYKEFEFRIARIDTKKRRR